MYTDVKNAQIVLALLKKYNVKKIVISPGQTNVPIARSVQIDSFFEGYSVVDERSAAYFATGLAFESGEPVAISCTGATASRNYLPALTEAYYRNLPIIALTSFNHVNDYGNFRPQSVNRTVSQVDVKRMSVNLPMIKDKDDEEAWILSVNKALTLATRRGKGPVHINLPVDVSDLSFTTADLPDIPKIEYYQADDFFDEERVSELKNQLSGRKIGLLIGGHGKFSPKETEAIEAFVDTYDVVVFYDHASNYHGKNRVLLSVASGLRKIAARPDIIVDIGGVTPVYSAPQLLNGIEFWRISEDGEFHQRYFGKLRKQFDCLEYTFFNILADRQSRTGQGKYYDMVVKNMGEVVIPNLPFSSIFVASQVAPRLPEGCSFHIGASESLSNMNMFEIARSIDSSANVGTLGIDGSVSTLVGQSMGDRNRLYFGQVGDLTFFYDMNVLGNRHIGKNIRLLLVNNGRGVRFRVTSSLNAFDHDVDEFIAAAGHNGSAEGWARSMGFEYLVARNAEEFLGQIDDFCSPDIHKFDKPVLFEIFIADVEDEQKGWELMRSANWPVSNSLAARAKDIAKQILPKKAVDVLRKLKE